MVNSTNFIISIRAVIPSHLKYKNNSFYIYNLHNRVFWYGRGPFEPGLTEWVESMDLLSYIKYIESIKYEKLINNSFYSFLKQLIS